METILASLPGARRALFANFHIGGCQSCAYRDDETLEEVCRRNEVAVEDAMRILLESHAHDREMLLTPAALRERLEPGASPVVLIDTRTREEHEAVSLPGARLMTQELQQELFGGPTEQTIVLFDHRGREVLDHCAWFRGHGLARTYGLEGGIDAWSREIDDSVPRYRIELDT